MSLMILTLHNINVTYKILSLFMIILVIYVSSHTKAFLPFLGPSVFPPSLFQSDLIPDGDAQKVVLDLDVENGTRVIYWAAKPDDNKIKENPIEAYGDYSNTGIAKVEDKKAILYFNCPTKYRVGLLNTALEQHIHYRLIYPNNPMISNVFTKTVRC